ncbi:MAG: hypothetical protein WD492_12645 [Alkalispirochaeta sp.]
MRKIAIVVVIVALMLGCENPFQEEDDTGTAPVIDDLALTRNGASVRTTEFYIGDTLTFYVFCTDPDTDMSVIDVEIVSADSDEYYQKDSIALPETDNTEPVWTNSEPSTIVGPAGDYIVKATITDDEGNTSNTWEISIDVLE